MHILINQSLFDSTNISSNLDRKRPRSSTGVPPLNKSKSNQLGQSKESFDGISTNTLQVIFNSKYISLAQQNESNVHCIFHNGVNSNKCDPNRKQRMIIFHFGRNIQKLFRLKIRQMECKQGKNRKYSFNFGLILVKNFFYDYKKFTNHFETYDENLSIYTLSNGKANQTGINTVESKFIYLKCSCIANNYICAVYTNDKKQTLYQESKFHNRYCVSLNDILSIEYDSDEQVIYFKKNDLTLSTHKIEENFNKLDAFYGLSSIGCDCSKNGNISFEAY